MRRGTNREMARWELQQMCPNPCRRPIHRHHRRLTPSAAGPDGPQADWDSRREDAMRGRHVYLDAGKLPGHTHTSALRLWLSEWPPRELTGLISSPYLIIFTFYIAY